MCSVYASMAAHFFKYNLVKQCIVYAPNFILEYITLVIEKTESLDKLQFLQTRNPDMGKPRYKVTMGIMPDYAFEGPGVKIDGVTDDRPAAKAGMQQGDVLIEMDGNPVNNMKDYMAELGKRLKGDTIPVKVKRGNEVITLNVTF